MDANFGLKLRAMRKSGWHYWQNYFSPRLRSRGLQSLLLVAASMVLLWSGFIFLAGLVGAAIAALVLMIVLDKAFGWKLVVPQTNF